MDKVLIARRFEQAKETYQSHATVQFQMAEQLVAMAANYLPKHLEKVFELGCGTGFLTEAMLNHFAINTYCANDLVSDVKSTIGSIVEKYQSCEFSFLEGDMEKILFPEKLSMICSGAAIQWIKDLPVFFKKAYEALSTKGFLVVSTFGPNNYSQIKKLTGCGIEYTDAMELMQMASDYFKVVDFKEWHQPLYFDTPLEVLKHMRLTGVNGVSPCKWTKKNMRDFIQNYEYFRCEQGYPLTYHPLLLILQKR